jgi:type IV pilus assembly protein PilO
MNIMIVKEVIKIQPRTFILIVVLFLVNISFYLFSAVYQKPRFESLQNQWFDKRKIATGGAVPDTTAVYQQGVKDLKTWRERIIPKKGFAGFIGRLFEAAANNSLSFKGVSYKVLQLKEPGLAAYALDFSVAGKYAAVKSYLSDIERMPEIIAIENISLNNKNSTEDAIDLKVQLTVYLRLEEQ